MEEGRLWVSWRKGDGEKDGKMSSEKWEGVVNLRGDS